MAAETRAERTPSPLQVQPRSAAWAIVDGRISIADVYEKHYADLFAAAPTTRANLDALLEAGRTLLDGGYPSDGSYDTQAVANLRAAIEKATGNESEGS